jgi:glycosyltransferase involved in cell wall biosynthesis
MGGKSFLEDLFNKSVFAHILSKTNVVISGTFQIKEYAEKYSKTSTKFLIVENGVNTSYYRENLAFKREYRKNLKIADTKTVVLFVGRFEEVKGIIEFSHAAKMLASHSKDFEMIIVGEGKLLPVVKSITAGIENIRHLGWVSSERIHEIYIASDIFILPSKFEALPLTIIEAMNAHLFIIYSSVGGVGGILEGYNKKAKLPGITAQDIFDETLKVTSCQSLDTIDNASVEYANTFDWKSIANKINRIYEELASKG